MQIIAQSQVYSKFDYNSGFYQFHTFLDNIPKTTFFVPQGQYQWLVMSFGLPNSPNYFLQTNHVLELRLVVKVT